MSVHAAFTINHYNISYITYYLGGGEVHVGACVGEHSLSVPLRCGGCETDGHKPLKSIVRETLFTTRKKEEGGRMKEEGGRRKELAKRDTRYTG